MTDLNRRTMLQWLAAAPAAAVFTWTDAEARAANAAARASLRQAAQAGAAFQPQFFTAHEWATVRTLVDDIIPRDDRSGSATEAAVPEFMDFMMIDQPNRQTAMRGGLAWLDQESRNRFDRDFAACNQTERHAVLDDISWPARAPDSLAHGVRFFATFRDLTASGFWTSKMGIEDLGYQGNVYLSGWDGCPEPALRKLGLTPGH